MLVLSRKEGEAIYIGQAIKVVVVKVEFGKIRLGISAPKDVTVLREELCETVWGKIPIIEPKGESR